MFNLDEEWKKAYEEYLLKEEKSFGNDLDSIFEELTEARNEIARGYDILETYYNMLNDNEEEKTLTEIMHTDSAPVGTTVEINHGQVQNNQRKDSTEGNTRDVTGQKDVRDRNDKANMFDDPKSKYYYNAADVMKTLVDLSTKTDVGNGTYLPAATFTTQKITDMKFGERIVFFIKQFVAWIRNVVLFFIEKIKNLIRKLVGAPVKELDTSKLKLDLTKAKKIESIATTSIDFGKGASDVPAIAKAWRIQPDDISLMESWAEDLGIVVRDKKPVKEQPVVVTLDFSRDIMNLKELMQHFYDLFDSAYGSNNEKLFGIDDLKIIIQMFQSAIEQVKTGNVNTYSVGGYAVEANSVNADRVRDNLILTNTNINNLKQAYVQTSNKIKDITKIINGKEIQAITDLGISATILTASTYEQIMRVVETIPERMKEATAMQKDMEKMKSAYETILKEVSAMQRTLPAVSNVTYESAYNRKIIDLIHAAKWMNDTVTLRLAGLTLYIKELKDVRDALTLLANLNSGKSLR